MLMRRFPIGPAWLPALALVGALFFTQYTLAGPLATTNFALNDSFGPDAGRWHGSVAVAGANSGEVLSAEIDWAAFAPGRFQFYLNSQGIAQVDPSGANEITYVYQITSIAAASPGIETLTVGVDAADGRGIVSAPSFVPIGAATEQSPASGGDQGTSMAWFFNGAELLVGDTSSLLVFTSPFAPEFDFLQVNSGLASPFPPALAASPSDRLPVIVPEPVCSVLAFSACMALGGVRRAPRRPLGRL
jgi:hypothetical protein